VTRSFSLSEEEIADAIGEYLRKRELIGEGDVARVSFTHYSADRPGDRSSTTATVRIEASEWKRPGDSPMPEFTTRK